MQRSPAPLPASYFAGRHQHFMELFTVPKERRYSQDHIPFSTSTMSETMSARTSSKRKSAALHNDSAVDRKCLTLRNLSTNKLTRIVSSEEPRTPKRRQPAAPTTPTNRRTSATITRRGSNNKIRRSGTQRPQRPQQSPSTPSTPEQPKWIPPDSSLSPQTVAWLKSAPSTPVSQFHPHLKTCLLYTSPSPRD